MFNTAKRALAILLALAMVFSLAACSEPAEEESVEVIVSTVYKEEEGDKDNTSKPDDATSGDEKPSDTPSTSTPSTSTPSGSTNYPNPMVNADPADYKGTTIIFASTIDPKDDGTDYVVSKFEKEYGIKVEIIVPTLENYNAEMSNLIAAGNAPTVGRSNGDAPIYVGYFDSLDKAKLNFKAELWNQNTFKLSTYNGQPYLCDTLGNFWTEIDMVTYSKSMLKKANCPTPKELDEQGNWTLDSFITIGKKTKAEVPGCLGAGIANKDSMLHMAGGAVYRADKNNKMVNGIDSKTVEVMKKIAQAWQVDKTIVSGGANEFINGTISIYTGHLWALRKDGNLKNHANYNDIGFYYLPAFEKGGKAAVTGLFRGWGIMRKCNENPKTGPKSAVAGGFFLSEYLNVENYDLNKSFISEEAKTFFFKLCSLYAETDNYNPYYTTYDLNEGISGMDDDKVVYAAMYAQPAQVDTLLKSAKSAVDHAAKKLNDYIDQQIYSN